MKTQTKLNLVYHAMLARCYNPNSKGYKDYGGRGIAEGLTIDRIDNNKGYSPSNCRWVTVAEQNRNKTTTKKKGAENESL